MAGRSAGRESIIQVDYLGPKVYEWTFQVPPRSTLIKHLSVNPRALQFGDLKFVDGVLGKIEHAWEFRTTVVGVDQLSVQIWLWIKSSQDYGVKVHDWELHTFEGNRLKKKRNCQTEPIPQDDYFYRQGFQGWKIKPVNQYINQDSEIDWDDSVDRVKVVFNIQFEPNGKLITLPPHSDSTGISALNPKEMDAGEFFLSENLSDVVMVSGGQEFPAHRFLLSCKSPVFHRMFQSPMKESLEGRVVIDDMKPTVLKEMLYFTYNGEFTDNGISKDVCVDLFKSAEKYEIQALKTACAKEIAKTFTFENAFEVYILGATHNDHTLMNTAEEVLKRNKTRSIQDPTMLREIANRYPELAFNLFNA